MSSLMGFGHRRLLSSNDNDTSYDGIMNFCATFCSPSNTSTNCQPFCLLSCPVSCPSLVPPPSPPPINLHTHLSKLNKVLIGTLVAAASAFLLVFLFALYAKYYSGQRRRRTRRRVEEERNDTQEDFLDEEDHAPVVDHHIWYINTVGLQPSVISSISVCKYKRGDGLVEGTECSVCLNEFQEDEALRLLPKCSHAFHIPCIDTWLRSHTSCPMCRAPIVSTTVVGTSSEANTSGGSTSGGEENRVDVVETGGEPAEEDEEGEGEGENGRRCEDGEETDEVQPVRRSFSMDSLSALKISQALANVPRTESGRDSSDRRSGKEIVQKRVGGNQSLIKLMTSSSVGRSLQVGTSSSLKRSISCSGKLFMARYGKNHNSALPL